MKASALDHIGITIAPLLSAALKTLGPISKHLPAENPIWLACHLFGTHQAKKTCAANGKALSTRVIAETARSELLIAQNWTIIHARTTAVPAVAEGLKAINDYLAQAIMVIDSELLATSDNPARPKMAAA